MQCSSVYMHVPLCTPTCHQLIELLRLFRPWTGNPSSATCCMMSHLSVLFRSTHTHTHTHMHAHGPASIHSYMHRYNLYVGLARSFATACEINSDRYSIKSFGQTCQLDLDIYNAGCIHHSNIITCNSLKVEEKDILSMLVYSYAPQSLHYACASHTILLLVYKHPLPIAMHLCPHFSVILFSWRETPVAHLQGLAIFVL